MINNTEKLIQTKLNVDPAYHLSSKFWLYLKNKLKTIKNMDWSYYSSNGKWLYGVEGINVLVSIAISSIAAYLLSPEIFGSYKYLISLAGMAAIFSLSGAGSTILRSAARGFDGTFLYLYKKHLLFNILTGSIILGMSVYYFILGNVTFGITLAILSVATPIINNNALSKSFLAGKSRFKELAIYNLLYILLPAIFFGAAMFYTDSISILVLVNFGTLCVVSIIATIFITKFFIKNNESIEDDSFSLAKNLSLIKNLSVFLGHVEQIIIFQMLGPASLALYVYILSPVKQLWGLNLNLRNLIAPKFSKLTLGEIKDSIKNKILIFYLCSLLVYFLYYFSSPYIFSMLFPQYTEGIFMTRIAALIIFTFPSILYLEILTAFKKTKDLLIIQISFSTFKIGFGVASLIIFGLLGLIISFVASYFLFLILNYIFYQKLCRSVSRN